MNSKILILWTLLLLVIAIWIIYPIFIAKHIPIELRNGQPVDSFGALNTLFSGFAFAVLIYTIIQQNYQLGMQKEELSLQRRELELTRIELNRSASAQESTEKSIKNQAKLMEYSSKLDGLKTLLQTYRDNSESKHYTIPEKETFRRKTKDIEKEIERLIEGLSKMIN